MSILDKITRNKPSKPPRIILYGTEGIGKSTWASEAPKPIFLPTEDGIDWINCDSVPLIRSYDEALSHLYSLYVESHDYQTVVIDSLDWLEKLIHKAVCEQFGVENIEKAAGGYAKGYKFALDRWTKIVEALDQLRTHKGMLVIGIAHAKVEKFQDPETTAYDRYSLRMHKDSEAYLKEWADCVLFAHKDLRVATEDAGFNKTRGVAQPVGQAGGERLVRCIGTPAVSAKNRLGLPEKLPLKWEAFINAISK